jgi:hypothetical protein
MLTTISIMLAIEVTDKSATVASFWLNGDMSLSFLFLAFGSNSLTCVRGCSESPIAAFQVGKSPLKRGTLIRFPHFQGGLGRVD